MSRTFRRIQALHLADGYPCLQFHAATAHTPAERQRRARFHADHGHRLLQERYPTIAIALGGPERLRMRAALHHWWRRNDHDLLVPPRANRHQGWDYS